MKNIIIANWKMNPTSLAEAKKLFNGIKANPDVETVVCPPSIYLAELKGKGVKLGAQDCSWEEKGSFTGDVSARMLKNLGAEYVILGHSERRRYYNETHAVINRKMVAAQKAGLKVVLCIENIKQLRNNLKGIENWKFKSEKLLIAYEPAFAIGTGNPCSPARAKAAKELIQKNLKAVVLYGGSTDVNNVKSYINEAGFNGLLVGGASLDAGKFNKMINEFK